MRIQTASTVSVYDMTINSSEFMLELLHAVLIKCNISMLSVETQIHQNKIAFSSKPDHPWMRVFSYTLVCMARFFILYGTLTLTIWPLYTSLTRIFWRCDPQTKMNFLRQGFRKLSYYRQSTPRKIWEPSPRVRRYHAWHALAAPGPVVTPPVFVPA